MRVRFSELFQSDCDLMSYSHTYEGWVFIQTALEAFSSTPVLAHTANTQDMSSSCSPSWGDSLMQAETIYCEGCKLQSKYRFVRLESGAR